MICCSFIIITALLRRGTFFVFVFSSKGNLVVGEGSIWHVIAQRKIQRKAATPDKTTLIRPANVYNYTTTGKQRWQPLEPSHRQHKDMRPLFSVWGLQGEGGGVLWGVIYSEKVEEVLANVRWSTTTQLRVNAVQHILDIFSPPLNWGVIFSVCLLMLASCPPSTRCPVFRATVGETAVAQLCHVTSPSDHLLPALTRSRPVVLITACFSAPRPICLTLIRLIFQCEKLWAATALRIPAQICARLQLEGPIRRPQGLSTQQILSNLLTYIQKWLR